MAGKKRVNWISAHGSSKGFPIRGSVKVRMLQSTKGIAKPYGRKLKKGDVIKVSKQVADILERHNVGKRVHRRRKR